MPLDPNRIRRERRRDREGRPNKTWKWQGNAQTFIQNFHRKFHYRLTDDDEEIKKRRKKHIIEETNLIEFGFTDNSQVTFEIVFQELQLEANELGRGAYGVVYKGKW